MSIETGGPAFPTESEAQTGCSTWRYEGMTLRDYFAAKAMQGLTSSAFNYMKGKGCATDAAMQMMQDIGGVSYRMADAMLAARDMGREG